MGGLQYNALDVSEFKHYRINHSKLFAQKQNHINGIENFYPSRGGTEQNGIKQRGIWENLTKYQDNTLIYFWKSANGDLILVRQTNYW